MLKSQGRAICRTRVIRENVPIKIIVFCMETPFWRPSQGCQNGGQKRVKTYVSYFSYFKGFVLSAELSNIHIVASLTMLAFQTSKIHGELMFSCK